MSFDGKKLTSTEQVVVAGMRQMLADVRGFHVKLDIEQKEELTPDDGKHPTERYYFLSQLVNILETRSKLALGHHKQTQDVGMLRMHLICEELAETIVSLRDGSTLKMLDGITDLLYVIVGTAVAFDLPIHGAWVEVQRSNMSKEKQPDDADAMRVRDKGPNYVAPDLEGVLIAYSKGEI